MVVYGVTILIICAIVRFIKPVVRPYAERSLWGAMIYMILSFYYTGGVHLGAALILFGWIAA